MQIAPCESDSYHKQTFRTGHFDEPNVLAHVRFDDRTGPNGEKVLHIAEVQSDWHQKGRKQGIRVNERLPSWLKIDQAERPSQQQIIALEAEHDQPAGARTAPAEQLTQRVVQCSKRAAQLRIEARQGSAVPDAPFKSSWHELAMKRMLRYAAENGYDRLSWDTGETQAERYDLSKQLDELHCHQEMALEMTNQLASNICQGGKVWRPI